jgi:hypothetical protein
MALERVDTYVREVGGRRVAEGEWGLSLDCAGVPLDVGLRASRGLLRAQAWACPAGSVDPILLLHRNRSMDLVRYACTRAGEVWVVGDVPVDSEALLDRLLGALVEAARVVREGVRA